MAENTYRLINKIRVGSGGASDMEFTSIPQSYKHLILHIVSRTNRSGVYQDNLSISYNGSTSSQSDRRIFGDTSSVYSYSDSALYSGLATAASTGANIYGSTTIFISNYSGDTYKSSSSDGGAPHDSGAGGLNLGAEQWANTSAITSIKISSRYSATFQVDSTAYLYGLGIS